MFEQASYRCPGCSSVVPKRVEDGDEFNCAACGRHFAVVMEPHSGKVGFVEILEKPIPEPLWIPRGSIRAMMTLALAITCWYLLFKGADVPDYLLGLLLTVIGYYFGFRKKMKTSESRIYDAAAKSEEPLFLPAGLVRFVLIAGFVATGVILAKAGRLGEMKYLEFFVILAGLVVGFVLAKITRRLERTNAYLAFNHLKGAVVLASCVALCAILLRGFGETQAYTGLILAAVVSFYFGSRS